MDTLELTAVLLALTAVLTYCNLRFLRLPHPIGVMVLALGMSLGLILLDHLSLSVGYAMREAVAEIDFQQTVLRWMLGVLLFAGGLTFRLDDLLPQKRRVFGLAILGTVLFVTLVGFVIGSILPRFHLPVTLLGCLTFAALISPTNPAAILDFLESPRVPQCVKTGLAGESLFSAAVVAVLFFVFVHAASGSGELSTFNTAFAFLVQDGCAIVLGLGIGVLALWLIRQNEHEQYAVLTSCAAMVCGYALAERLGICGPVAVACAGICLGNAPRRLQFAAKIQNALAQFWGPVEYALNTMLFVLLGLEVLVIRSQERLSYVALAVLLVWPILLVGRLVSVWVVGRLGGQRDGMRLPELAALTWGGPRGGISLALAMSLPLGAERNCWVAVTYVVVMLSIVVQGLTLNRLIPYLKCSAATSHPNRPVPRSTRSSA